MSEVWKNWWKTGFRVDAIGLSNIDYTKIQNVSIRSLKILTTTIEKDDAYTFPKYNL